jgi:hypothetical protein
MSLQKPIHQLSALPIQGREIFDQELHAISVRDDQGIDIESLDVFFPLQQEFRGTATGLN